MISSICLYFESPGPVIFKQKRLGRDRKYFKMYKIRKFHPDESEFGRGYTLASDSRCTKVGLILEKLKFKRNMKKFMLFLGVLLFGVTSVNTAQVGQIWEPPIVPSIYKEKQN